MAKKHITLDILAGMVKRGFDELGGRMDKFDSRMDKFEARLAHIDQRISHLDARVAMIEKDVAEIRKNIVYRDEFIDILSRLSYVERKLGIKQVK
ncbi:hypothetical protein A2W54_00010 [Candidatus Giovannonibacteria bacterium RIFCSPHIGHO2_02_43_13]|uniref:Uncharacterized protein n=1 Tax=Candidatus Giovannonibacteria bacterium RIFCSPHIGHO2_02_43_13 TaxID=1798330 RepID=A0A1F5WTQ8_9BACT|nr:MAG: hypothetical protein UW28_C0009G0004 [Parcubacteria group bacterium GW2011_GWA2_44_13]OGF71723.1 MAG: hypothetical protein A3E06_04150 [Candidatus Giovannonibacteria bacterium RIFCSPHIGHO2_12_FULL_44_42]OGF79028.1 MAG: hypothetical protein A2W54_00010 [Candidatus Giovannonibacteria bacterium RIFCSPHIGHO2_02_43_13]OGF90203.1 MAG: hypothetical protein A3I94_01500 [Candidatus Giovannonibacteria bacterium RIFCSPLOWO2_02_FULL_43_54]OGF96835.1 MAG: hypothetical protein A3H08_00865 [Candidatus